MTQPKRAVRITGRGPGWGGRGRAGFRKGKGRMADGRGGSRYVGRKVEHEQVDE